MGERQIDWRRRSIGCGPSPEQVYLGFGRPGRIRECRLKAIKIAVERDRIKGRPGRRSDEPAVGCEPSGRASRPGQQLSDAGNDDLRFEGLGQNAIASHTGISSVLRQSPGCFKPQPPMHHIIAMRSPMYGPR